MSAAGRVASKVGQAASKSAGKSVEAGSSQQGKERVLNKEAQRNPELYVLLAVVTGALGVAGYYFGRNPTSPSSQTPFYMTKGTRPWEIDSAKGDKAGEPSKYKYYPGRDKSKTPKDAPNTINVVIVPNVTAPKEAHDQFNKWGKEGW